MRKAKMCKRLTAILLIFLAAAFAVRCEASDKDYCVECHIALGGKAKEPADLIKDDVHFKRGLSCADCHGGDRTKDDFSEAKDPAAGFIGKPDRNNIPRFCGR